METQPPFRPPADVRSQLVGPLLAYLRATGHDPMPLVARFGLPANAASLPEVSLPLTTLHAFLDAAEALSGDAFLGLHVAQRVPRGTYGLVEYIARASATVRDTFRALARYMALLEPAWQASFQDAADGSGTFAYGIPGEPLAYGRHASEYGLALFVHVGRQLTEQPWRRPAAVAFAHPAPADIRPLVEHFGVTPEFGGGRNALTLDAATLDLRVVGADPVLLSVLERAAGAPLAAAPPADPPVPDFVQHVRDAIRASLQEGPPQVGDVARGLHVSLRTLQRRLADHGTSFQDEVDAVRRALSFQYLKDPHLGVSQVAFLLGYSELSTFDRAFKRWTGMTPRVWREGAEGG
ncbi:AraC family transcriptional regulator [Pyxidicoccus xibeiensis]|uniref:AraC family transcriptional regulator n=1 Tax=Pyxidicoccus xibeiensis TaxID=2906759 RepID=UPI0020A8076E|nr:AraC family transcriptional regulator ligand-binding domain-containing protein [Pyxidicoccus xibeiensis]MCP3139178.1 AraC family transcriptional regulator [Pyxidicoccus xibeiensis]